MREHAEVEAQLHAFCISAPDGDYHLHISGKEPPSGYCGGPIFGLDTKGKSLTPDENWTTFSNTPSPWPDVRREMTV